MPLRGTCCIRAEVKDLTFEHLPPQAAFNKGSARMETWEEAHARDPLDHMGGPIMQRGSGAYTLCCKCNADTGAWYVNEYTWWAYQAGVLLAQTQGDPRLTHLYHGYPLRFFRQVIVMMMSVAGPPLTERHQFLRRFLFSRNSREFNNRSLRLYAFYNPSNRIRQNPVAAILDVSGRRGTSTFTSLQLIRLASF
ncbi:MAG TPA: hypothetical protein VGL56_02545 [Fimbriimonadaceae bacterium]|jgi:hypothetical protein